MYGDRSGEFVFGSWGLKGQDLIVPHSLIQVTGVKQKGLYRVRFSLGVLQPPKSA